MTLLLWLCKTVHVLRHRVRVGLYRRLGAVIGHNVRLFGNLDGVNPDRITLGDNTVLAKNAQIITHCPVRGNAPVHIGARCYIGYGAIILPGVTVGDNCIIGAGSIVTHDIPPNSIAYGNPARVRRHRNAAELERTVRQVETGQAAGYLPDDPFQLCNYLDRDGRCLQESFFGQAPVPCLALEGKPCKWLNNPRSRFPDFGERKDYRHSSTEKGPTPPYPGHGQGQPHYQANNRHGLDIGH